MAVSSVDFSDPAKPARFVSSANDRAFALVADSFDNTIRQATKNHA
ncbi:hypothetical protein [Hoeflea sp. 108]|nr:hypothetical protein [Hoeflea sp. 108]